MDNKKGAKNVLELLEKCGKTAYGVAKTVYIFGKRVYALAKAALWLVISWGKTVVGFAKKWVPIAGKKAKAGVGYAVNYVKEDPRTVFEHAGILILATAALALAIHFLWPVVVGVAQTYFSDATKAIPLIVSSAALYVAWNNYRRGNSAIVKLSAVTTQYRTELSVNRSQPYSTFEVLIKVLGIPLHNPLVVIHARTSFGRLNIPLSQLVDGKPAPSTGGSLEKGMVACYGLRSFDMDHGQRQMLCQTADPDTVDVEIAVYSNGYFVKRFRLQWRPPLNRWVRKWNGLAYHINFHYLSRTRKKWGRPMLFHREYIPRFKDPMLSLEQFVSFLKHEAMGAQVPPTPWGPPGTQSGTMFSTNPPNAPPPPPVAE